VKLLEDSGWDGMRHFDAHAYRTEDAEGVWQFARGCMRTYLILREKVRRFHEDPEISAALDTAMVPRLGEPTSPDGMGAAAINALRREPRDLAAPIERGYGHEHLDQLVTELLLGAR
jgi:xylose isomerase